MKRTAGVGILCAVLGGCGPQIGVGDVDGDPGVDGKADSSAEATILDFEFDGQLTTASTWSLESSIRDQMLYTIGHLNGNRAVGRLDRLTLTNVRRSGSTVTYHAKMPVAWGAKTNLPTSYTFKLPLNVDNFDGFTTKYRGTCTDSSPHEIDSGSMWYYYRPNNSGCNLAAADIMTSTAKVTVSSVNTNGKYPEYHKVWEDNALKVVAIFGKYEDGATSTSDAGISAFNTFASQVKTLLAAYSPTTTPSPLPAAPGPGTNDVRWKATLPGGRTVEIAALLVDNISTAGADFDAKYEPLSTRADLIMYNGHAGLGQNVRALARKGQWTAGQYLIMFMNGCDTYAYVDGSMAQTRAALNPDDNQYGTKYLDIVTNGMPAFFASDAPASMALIKGLMKYQTPTTYQQIFAGVDRSQVVLVTGEEDNVYYPGLGSGGGGTTTPSKILDEHATVDTGELLQFATTDLDPGSYTVTLADDPAGTKGDADLYVRVGGAPTLTTYDCRPYLDGSNETCAVKLATRGKIYVGVNGYAAASFILTLTRDGAPGPAPSWAGIDETGSVAKSEEKRWTTPQLPAGSYVFAISGDGDSDLYVKQGGAPSTTTYDCRPYTSSSNETCTLNLAAPATVYVMVRGYATTSSFHLTARPQ
jgi:Bacterial pre-peptidase C-terminal domain